MSYSLGLDIGSVNVKLALLDDKGQLVYSDIERVVSGPKAAVALLINRLSQKFKLDDIQKAAVSGSGGVVIPKELGWVEYSGPLAIASGLLHAYPKAKTIIQIGGQSSLIIGLEDGLTKPWQVASNPLCAAGSGMFLEQQSYRLGISLTDFAKLALESPGPAPRIAARCSVFAKTDLIHLQQKGVSVSVMLHGLCDSLARMVAACRKGKFEEPIYFVGGVAANEAVVRSLNEVLTTRNGSKTLVSVPQNYLYVEALGLALLAKDSDQPAKITSLLETDTARHYFELPALDKVVQTNGWKNPKVDGPFTGYLGVDVGSTSTKAVILDETGSQVIAKSYLMTAGRPVDAVKQVFASLRQQVGDNARIAGVGVTGSGRYLVGSFIGADLIKNEITAQARAAADVDADADIIEIGGQDSKLVIKRNRVVVDYQMNKACAAGTGSFIDELADLLGISVKNGDFAKMAFQAPHIIDLGTRCAAFMTQAVASAQQQGVPAEIITASLANSIAGNYLSKVVGTKKLGQKVILTGAVFYNEAVVSAFKKALNDKTILVPEHKEVSGAMGAALLAKAEMNGKPSRFKGLQKVVDSECNLSTFICKVCDNNCTISKMDVPNEKPTFYGSRCDLFDSTLSGEKKETAFDEREKLLFAQYKEGAGKRPTVGIPRGLLVYDYAPLLIGFLNALDAKVVISNKTNKQIMEQAIELGYTDSCFPVKLLHGHAASLKECDYVIYPCFLRLGNKEGDENQKYSCPLVQASPFIIKQAVDLGEKLLIPFIDFSHGQEDMINSFADVAAKMGFSRKQGKLAALAGIQAQQEFEKELVEHGRKMLEQLKQNNQLGVVLFSRSYMSQDSGANLGIAEKLSQLGVVPVPLDFLPLYSVNVKEYSDRPYWAAETKHITGAVITAKEPQLYGLILTNFGCGPNAFVLNIVEDIIGSKPLGQLEIDEHAAEAGLVTRLEAFVDTIKGWTGLSKQYQMPERTTVYRSVPSLVRSNKTLLLPPMAAHASILAAAMSAFGVEAIVLPESDERNLLYSNMVTSGKECLPYRVTLGDFLRFFHEHNGKNGVEGFMPSSFGPCRLGKYALEQSKALRDMGYDLPLRSTVSNNAYADMGLSKGFERLAWRGLVAGDYLERLLWHFRPYEKVPGSTEQLFNEYMAKISDSIRKKEKANDLLKEAAGRFKDLADPDKPQRPLVGINGEIFLRSNKFSNSQLVKACENAGLEVVVSPMGEWIKYITHRNIEDATNDKNIKKMLAGYIRRMLQNHIEHDVASNFKSSIDTREPSTQDLLALSGHYLSHRCGSEAVLSIGSGIEWMESPRFAGVISVMPHGCMPGGVVAAMAEKLSPRYGKPWISLTYDGFAENTNMIKINNFAEIIKFCAARQS